MHVYTHIPHTRHTCLSHQDNNYTIPFPSRYAQTLNAHRLYMIIGCITTDSTLPPSSQPHSQKTILCSFRRVKTHAERKILCLFGGVTASSLRAVSWVFYLFLTIEGRLIDVADYWCYLVGCCRTRLPGFTLRRYLHQEILRPRFLKKALQKL